MTMNSTSSQGNSSNRYRAYGLTFDSEVELPWPAAASDGRPDVVIRLGEVPPALDSPVDGDGCWQTAPGAFLIGMAGAARCLVSEGGRRISLEMTRDGGDALVGIIDSVLAACLQMRGFLTLHASAVATAAGAALIVGRVAAGKSTLAAALVDRGYPLLADGIVGVVQDGGDDPLALAGFPSVNLWGSAIKVLDKPWRRAAAAAARPGIPRYPVPARRFHGDALVVRAVYVLANFDDHELVVKPLAPKRAFAALTGCTYRRGFLKGLGQEGMHFRVLPEVVRRAPVNALTLRWKAGATTAAAARIAESLGPPCR